MEISTRASAANEGPCIALSIIAVVYIVRVFNDTAATTDETTIGVYTNGARKNVSSKVN